MSTLSFPRIAAALFVVLVLVAGGAFLKLGMNPPLPVQTIVHKELPGTQFAASASQQADVTLPALPDTPSAPAAQH